MKRILLLSILVIATAVQAYQFRVTNVGSKTMNIAYHKAAACPTCDPWNFVRTIAPGECKVFDTWSWCIDAIWVKNSDGSGPTIGKGLGIGALKTIACPVAGSISTITLGTAANGNPTAYIDMAGVIESITAADQGPWNGDDTTYAVNRINITNTSDPNYHEALPATACPA